MTIARRAVHPATGWPARRGPWHGPGAQALATLLLGLGTPGHASPPGAAPAHVHTMPVEATELVQRAEAALAAGDTATAASLFERAAARWHAPDIEAGWARTMMQAGAYRQALAFAAHVAGAHPRDPVGSLLYAWLLHLGGQTAQASLLLDRARGQWPQTPAVDEMRLALAGAAPLPEHLSGLDDLRLAPYPIDRLPADARAVASATLVTPTQAVAPLASMTGESPTVWLRDGLGRTRRAAVAGRDVRHGVALLRIEQPFGPTDEVPAVAGPRDAFPGSPAFAVNYTVDHAVSDTAGRDNPQWPRMTSGFISRPHGLLGTLGAGLGALVAGGPVFDHSGQLIGMTLLGEDTRTLYAPLSVLRALGAAPASPPRVPARQAPDQIYETAMRTTLQVLVR